MLLYLGAVYQLFRWLEEKICATGGKNYSSDKNEGQGGPG
jgi:hypothetical protein